MQVICFYHKNYEFHHVSLKTSVDLSDRPVITSKKSSVICDFENFVLHLRIKPMNVFTTKSYKVNAAIDFKQPV